MYGLPFTPHSSHGSGGSSDGLPSPCCSISTSVLSEEIKRHSHYIQPKSGYVTEYEDAFRDPADYKALLKTLQSERLFKASPRSRFLPSTSSHYYSPILPHFQLGSPKFNKDAATEISEFDYKFLGPTTIDKVSANTAAGDLAAGGKVKASGGKI